MQRLSTNMENCKGPSAEPWGTLVSLYSHAHCRVWWQRWHNKLCLKSQRLSSVDHLGVSRQTEDMCGESSKKPTRPPKSETHFHLQTAQHSWIKPWPPALLFGDTLKMSPWLSNRPPPAFTICSKSKWARSMRRQPSEGNVCSLCNADDILSGQMEARNRMDTLLQSKGQKRCSRQWPADLLNENWQNF